jgi:hypothetical protein
MGSCWVGDEGIYGGKDLLLDLFALFEEEGVLHRDLTSFFWGADAGAIGV